jgi:hypothetical protein
VPELILGLICKTPGVKLQDLIIACKLQQWPELVDVYTVLCGNPTHYSVTSCALLSAIFRVPGLVQVDAEVFGWKNTCVSYIGKFEGIWALRTVD